MIVNYLMKVREVCVYLFKHCYIGTRLCTQLYATCFFAREDCICVFTSCTNINNFLLHVYIQIYLLLKTVLKKKNQILMYISTQENEFRQDS